MVERNHLRADPGNPSPDGVDSEVHVMYKSYHVLAVPHGCLMEAKKVLTGFLGESFSRPELMRQLAEAGLELWQAPEGFWAVRLKPVTVPPRVARPRRRLARSR
jgi:hypothetical protein